MGRKSKQARLQVILNGKKVGTLVRNVSGTLEFAYAEEWLKSFGPIPVSQSLPLRELPYRGIEVASYFDNLLPDNDDIRSRIAERMATEGRGTFDLLAAIGRDCIGALQFIPEGEWIEEISPVQGENLSHREIGNILKNLKSSPLGLDRQKEFRISLAGVQEKTALLRWQEHWNRPKGSTPTTHIFKPTVGKLPYGIDMSESVQNEWLCLNLAEYFGLVVARTEMQRFDGVECLVVERFDRQWSQDGKYLRRVPQEDLCQALGIPWSRKYESDGGPGIVTMMNFLNTSDQRDRDREHFLRAQLVFFLLGAIDGHAKNFSITLLPTGFQLAPIYDVMSILPALAARQVEPKQAKLAMSVGDSNHYRLDKIHRRYWEQTAKKAGFPLRDLRLLIQDLIDRGNKLDSLASRLNKVISSKLMDSVMAGVKRHLKALM